MAFLVCFLKVSVMEGNGGFHLSDVPRSPSVPIVHR